MIYTADFPPLDSTALYIQVLSPICHVFAEWKQSDTAKLFEVHGYKNKKQAGGYFF